MEDKYQLAQEYFNNNDFETSESLLFDMLREDPEDYDVYNFLGIIQLNKKEYQRAINCFERILPFRNGQYGVHYNLGLAYQYSKNYDSAIYHYKKVIEFVPEHIDALNNLGVANLNLKNYSEAQKYFSICMTLNPNDAKIFNNYGNLFFAEENTTEALKYYKIASELNKGNYDYFYNLANCYIKENDYDRALENYNKALSINPNHIPSLNNISNIHNKLNNFKEAEKCLNTILVNEDAQGDINNAVVSTNAGVAKFMQQEFVAALEFIDEALRINPDLFMAHYNKAHIHLLLGQFDIGWEEYEWRTKRPDFIQRKLNKGKRLKDQDLTNKKVFVYDEQGLGDSLQFVRYLPMLKAKGCSIIFECDKRLKSLYKQFDFIDTLIERCENDEPPFYYDYHLPLLTLPYYFHTNLSNLPADIPYLKPDPSFIDKWKPVIDKNYFNIGIVWAGSPTHAGDQKRSVALNRFNEIAKIPGVKLYSLQKGNPTSQISKFEHKIIDLDAMGLNSFSDTAAVINQLDLIITVDTSVAHLAGALGKETWIMISQLPDWRWLLNRDDSPWYPSVKLFRQNEPDNWNTVFEQIAEELLKKVELKNIDVHVISNDKPTIPQETINDSNDSLYLGLISGDLHGWGVCSKYLIKELSKLCPVYLIENIADLEQKESIEGTVFQALIDTYFKPLYNVNSKNNFGYTFFETELADEVLPNTKNFNTIFAGSTWCRDKLRDKDINNCDLLLQGVDPEIFYPENVDTNPNLFVIFSGGKFELRKGQDIVLKAVSILQKKYKDIVLMNSWTNVWEKPFNTMSYSKYIKFNPRGASWDEVMKNIYADNDLDISRVITLPMVENQKMRNVYLKTDLGLFPNRCEGGTNLVLMEYMAMGKPVVASFNTGHKDIINNDNSLMIKHNSDYKIYSSDNKLLFDWKEPDIDEIIERVEYAYLNRDEIKKIGINAGEFMKDYSWEKTAKTLYSKLFRGNNL